MWLSLVGTFALGCAVAGARVRTPRAKSSVSVKLLAGKFPDRGPGYRKPVHDSGNETLPPRALAIESVTESL
jgi:hypothetical protein